MSEVNYWTAEGATREEEVARAEMRELRFIVHFEGVGHEIVVLTPDGTAGADVKRDAENTLRAACVRRWGAGVLAADTAQPGGYYFLPKINNLVGRGRP